MQVFGDDWIADTQHLTAAEEGIYWRFVLHARFASDDAVVRSTIPDRPRRRMFIASVSFLITFAGVRLLVSLVMHNHGPFGWVMVRGLHIHHLVWGILILLFVPFAMVGGVFLHRGRVEDVERAGQAVVRAQLQGRHHRVTPDVTGAAQRLCDESVSFARNRIQFGKPIAEHQAVAFRLADMALRVDAARLLTWRAARMLDAGRRATKEAAMAKLHASETAMWCTWAAVQTLGGWGYSREYPVEKWMRDAKLEEIEEGTSDIQRLVIARGLLR